MEVKLKKVLERVKGAQQSSNSPSKRRIPKPDSTTSANNSKVDISLSMLEESKLNDDSMIKSLPSDVSIPGSGGAREHKRSSGDRDRDRRSNRQHH